MTKKMYFVLTTIVLWSWFLPAFAEVTELTLDKTSYSKGEYINASGRVTEDASGLVTIVLRDPNNKFVLLSQALIQGDDSFEKTIPVNEKFQIFGNHNATAFVLNMTAGKTQSFDLVSSPKEIMESTENLMKEFPDADLVFENTEITEPIIDTKPEIIKPAIPTGPIIEKQPEIIKENNLIIANFVDKNKDPQYYLDRYYNEAVYKSWFDRNYPGLTIEEAIGYTTPTQESLESDLDILRTELIPNAQASSVSSATSYSQDNSDLAHLGLAMGGLAILFGAVYGIKRKIGDNSKHISLNKDIIRRRLIAPIIEPNPIGIIQTRLAKGEITIEEYEKLKQKLEKKPK